MKKYIYSLTALVIVYSLLVGLQNSLNYVSLNNSPFYQPILNASTTKSNLINTANGLVIVSSKSFSDGYYLVTINNLNGNDSAVAVLQKVNGTYTVILGPGTTFYLNGSVGLPKDVFNYLNSKGLNSATH